MPMPVTADDPGAAEFSRFDVVIRPVIDLTSLRKALDALEGAWHYWLIEPDDSGRKPHLRAGVIQSFAFGDELALRSLRRVMERAIAAPLVTDLSFNDLLRAAADAGLLPDAITWRRWRDWRNWTSHSDDEAQAQAIAEAARAFLAEARRLQERLQRAVVSDEAWKLPFHGTGSMSPAAAMLARIQTEVVPLRW